MSLDERVMDLLLLYEENLAAGKPVSPEVLCAGCPELLPEVRNGIEQLRRLSPWLDEPTPTTAPAGETDLNRRPPLPEGSRYHSLNFHDKGGLGEVYCARDGLLNRKVALKRIQDRWRDHAESRRRFLREAEITASLAHPGVVPVYDLEYDAEGQPRYAMRFIEGESLADALERYHGASAAAWADARRGLELRQLLARFVAVCNTIAYAHSCGVIHRDLKPANVMLGRFGETLVVDWGLAKDLGRAGEQRSGGEDALAQAASDDVYQITRAGAVAGTVSYMSPEQASGRLDAVGPASDVFALGATLYAILTGQAPYLGPDMLGQARRGRVRPPRAIKRDVPRALEAVCRKAMAAMPDDRYASAQELAADLENWLGDEPVSALRESLHVRLGRWSRRRKTLVATAVTLLFTATVALVVGTYLVAARDRAELARREEENEKLKAQDSEHKAKIARQEEEEKKLNAQYDRQLAENKKVEAERISKELAGMFTLSDVMGWRDHVFHTRSNVGDKGELRDMLDRAKHKIVQDKALEPLARATLMDTIGENYRVLGMYGEAAPLLEEAYDIRISQHGNEPDPDVATSLHRLADLRRGEGEFRAAKEFYERAAGLRRKLELDDEVAATMLSLAYLLTDMWEFEQAEELFLRVTEQRGRLQGERAQRDVALAQAGMAALLLASQGAKSDFSSQYFSLTAKALSVLNPKGNQLALIMRYFLGDQAALAAIKGSEGPKKAAGLARAEEMFKKCEEDGRELLGPYHPILGVIRGRRALFAMWANDWNLAETHCREAKQYLVNSIGYTHPRASQVVTFIAETLWHNGKKTEAEGLFQEMLRAREAHKSFGREHPAYADAQVAHAIFLEDICGDKNLAIDCYREAAMVYRQTARPWNDAALGLWRGGRLALEVGTAREAESLLLEALAWVQKAPNDHRVDLGRLHESLGVARVKLGKCAEAASDFRSAQLASDQQNNAAWRCREASIFVGLLGARDVAGLRNSAENLIKELGERADPSVSAEIARRLVLIPPAARGEAEAFQSAERAKDATGYARLRGAALYRAGKWQAAATQLEKAIEVEPEYATAYLFLAMARFKLKDTEGAWRAAGLASCCRLWGDHPTASTWRYLGWRDGLEFDFLLPEVEQMLLEDMDRK
jgi:serine/threonine protein kinase